MTDIEKFEQWLHNNTALSDSSAYKYAHAVGSVSDDMLHEKVIHKSLYAMNQTELDISVTVILNTPSFILKNKTGNNMYSNALKHYRYFLYASSDNAETETAIIEKINGQTSLAVTERKALISARVGQGLFRQSLIEKYHGECVITHVNNPKLLVASHIKPWAVSDNRDRISADNGLLFTPTYDRLFDSGLISFRDNGSILLSSFIGNENLTRLNIDKDATYDLKISSEMLKNLGYHRDVIFIG